MYPTSQNFDSDAPDNFVPQRSDSGERLLKISSDNADALPSDVASSSEQCWKTYCQGRLTHFAAYYHRSRS